jgi:hypothetical protein
MKFRFSSILPSNFLIIFSFLLLIHCNNDDDIVINPDDLVSENCDQLAIVDQNLYENGSNFQYWIDSAYIEAHCLMIGVEYSGCISNIEALLVDAGSIMESLPAQRNIKLIITTEITGCEPLFYKSFSFDLTPLQVTGDNQVSLNLSNYNQSILYTY